MFFLHGAYNSLTTGSQMRQSHLFKFTAYRIEENILISVFHWLLIYVFTMKNNQLFSTNREVFRYPKPMVTITINDWGKLLHLDKALRCTIGLQQCVCITSGSYEGGGGWVYPSNWIEWNDVVHVPWPPHTMSLGVGGIWKESFHPKVKRSWRR